MLRASFGTTTGMIIRAVLNKRTKFDHEFGKTIEIMLDGTAWTPQRVKGTWREPTPIGHIDAIRDNVRRVADHCKLNDADRIALFDELRMWVGKDHRATSTGELKGVGDVS